MPAVAHDVTVREREAREDGARPVVYTTLYDLIAAVNDAIEPGEGGALSCAPSADAVAGNGRPLNWAPSADAVAGEEASVVPIVAHLLRAGRVRFLRDVDAEMLWAEDAPADVLAEALGVPA